MIYLIGLIPLCFPTQQWYALWQQLLSRLKWFGSNLSWAASRQAWSQRSKPGFKKWLKIVMRFFSKRLAEEFQNPSPDWLAQAGLLDTQQPRLKPVWWVFYLDKQLCDNAKKAVTLPHLCDYSSYRRHDGRPGSPNYRRHSDSDDRQSKRPRWKRLGDVSSSN